jgi:hypothetical protein
VIPWWYLGGAVVTLVVGVFLHDSLNVSTSPVLMWGPMIGMEVRQRRLATETDQNRRRAPGARPQRAEAIFAGLFTSLALGVGILLGFLFSLDDAEPVDATAAVTGTVLVLIPLIVVAAILARRRSTSRSVPPRE